MVGAASLPLESESVLSCLDPTERPGDALFARAVHASLAALEPDQRRGALPGIIGHVAESVVEGILEGHAWTPIWHFVAPGRHGVDLMFLGPAAERLIAVEVKGTLRRGRWPGLRRAETMQMAVEWLDKSDNPAMAEWNVTSADVYGAIVLVNLHDLVYRKRPHERLRAVVPRGLRRAARGPEGSIGARMTTADRRRPARSVGQDRFLRIIGGRDLA